MPYIVLLVERVFRTVMKFPVTLVLALFVPCPEIQIPCMPKVVEMPV